MKVFLAGPIDYWWNENWESAEHIAYLEWRKKVNRLLVEAGHLVYRPHEAIKGAWDESFQAVNDLAIELCDVFVYLTPEGVPAFGTEAEKNVAKGLGKEILWAPPGDTRLISGLIKPLDDPYGDVNRKSYSKPACQHPDKHVVFVKRLIGRKMYVSNFCQLCKARFYETPLDTPESVEYNVLIDSKESS